MGAREVGRGTEGKQERRSEGGKQRCRTPIAVYIFDHCARPPSYVVITRARARAQASKTSQKTCRTAQLFPPLPPRGGAGAGAGAARDPALNPAPAGGPPPRSPGRGPTSSAPAPCHEPPGNRPVPEWPAADGSASERPAPPPHSRSRSSAPASRAAGGLRAGGGTASVLGKAGGGWRGRRPSGRRLSSRSKHRRFGAPAGGARQVGEGGGG